MKKEPISTEYCPTDPLLNCPRCQEVSPYLAFCKDGLGYDLPPHHYRCPVCRFPWRMGVVEPAVTYSNGYWVPAKRELMSPDLATL